MGKGSDSELVVSHLKQDAGETIGSLRCPGLPSHLLEALQSPLAAARSRDNANAALCSGKMSCLKSLSWLVHRLSLKYRNREAEQAATQETKQGLFLFLEEEEEEEEGWCKEGGSKEDCMSGKEGIT